MLALAGMIALVAGAWYVGGQSVSGATPASAGDGMPSIAVMPFLNMSSDPEQEYFSDGISEELTNLLAEVPELRVASRTSAFSFKDQELELPEIGKRLNVAHVLEGSVRKAVEFNDPGCSELVVENSFSPHKTDPRWERFLEDHSRSPKQLAGIEFSAALPG